MAQLITSRTSGTGSKHDMVYSPHRLYGAIRDALAVRRRRLYRLSLALLLITVSAWLIWPRRGIPARVENDTVLLPLSPPSNSAWTTEHAYPKLRFFEPMSVVPLPGSDECLILERRGTIQLVAADRLTTTKRQVLDISEQVIRTPYDDDGALGLVLHPEFGQADSPNSDFLYLFYTAVINDKWYDRLSRFRWSSARRVVDPESELVLIDQLDESLWHNGGALAFGSDGFLYVGVGDEGSNGDALGNGQRVDKDLFSGVLRIDVDQIGGDVSHPPKRQPETGRTAHYFIPNDNPFVGSPHVLEEFWALGLRNPHRIAFDSQGRLWTGDVGHLLREEVNLVGRGSNHGWSYEEGSLPFEESYLHGEVPDPYHGIHTPPLLEYPHLHGNNCIIGGFVYEGDEFPELTGKYVFGDNGSGRIWALEYDGQQVVSNVQLTSLPVSSKTGISSIDRGPDGEILIVVLGEADQTAGSIHRLVKADEHSAALLPRKLSQTGLFEDLETLTPSAGVIAYTVNAPLWSDGAVKQRWIMLPGDGSDPDPQMDRVQFSNDDPWKFPTGTVFVKHFELPVDEANVVEMRRLETRVLVRTTDGGVYGVSYKWDTDGADAELVVTSSSESIDVKLADGSIHQQTWQFMNRDTCYVCHNAQSNYVLGVNARQLNCEYEYPGRGVVRHQLQEWNRAGLFTTRISAAQIDQSPRLVSVHDSTASLESRVSSYLDVNCASCHRPGAARARFDARFGHDLHESLVNAKPQQGDFGIRDARLVAPGEPYRSVLYYRMAKVGKGRMPHAGVELLDRDAHQLIHDWISQLGEASEPQEASDNRPSDLARLCSSGCDDAGQIINELLSQTESAFCLWDRVYQDNLPGSIKDEVISAGLAHQQASVRDLFERFLPVDQRTELLGEEIDPERILATPGDVARGAELFFKKSGLQCRSCHQVNEGGVQLGPNLTRLTRRMDRRELLESILYPSNRIDPEYQMYVVTTLGGKVFSGIRTSNSNDELSFGLADGSSVTIAASEIDFMQPHPKSMMPDQLLRELTVQEAADLVEYIFSIQSESIAPARPLPSRRELSSREQ